MAITGDYFAVAKTWAVVVCTNEGNADMGVNAAPVQIHCGGIKKMIPRMDFLGVFTQLLARSATRQPVTTYTPHYMGPKPGEQMLIVIVDNGRSKHLGKEDYRNALKCIRCGESLVMTSEGFIIHAGMLNDDLEEERKTEPEDNEPTEYMVVLSSSKNVVNASLYQLEYVAKKMLSKESKFIAVEKQHAKNVFITFFGTIADVIAIENKSQSSGFTIANLYYANQDNS